MSDPKVQAYLGMNWSYLEGDTPTFTISINTDEVSFQVIDVTESEIRELMKDIEEMLSLYLDVVKDHKDESILVVSKELRTKTIICAEEEKK